jgi:hypothetical protein
MVTDGRWIGRFAGRAIEGTETSIMLVILIIWFLVGIPVCLISYAVNGKAGLTSSIVAYLFSGLAVVGAVLAGIK